ncbi:P-loop containing nucleoside triphosphate hydrolase protein [Schizophyllum commune]
MDNLRSLVQPLGLELMVLGGAAQTAKRMTTKAWTSFINSFFLTAHFHETDMPYAWLMLWLSKQPEWGRTRECEGVTMRDRAAGEDDALSLKVVFQPTFESQLTIYFRGHWLRVWRWKKDSTDEEVLSVSVVARSSDVLKTLVRTAKKEYEASLEHSISLFIPAPPSPFGYYSSRHYSRSANDWTLDRTRPKRPLRTVVLERGIKESIVDDVGDFLASEKWYGDRGIPFRRGYLLHGPPGNGKSSLIYALASHYALDVYTISLSAPGMTDESLGALIGGVPSRCILLLKDLDTALAPPKPPPEKDDESEEEDKKNGDPNNNPNNGSNSNSPNPPEPYFDPRRRKAGDADPMANTLSLSGLLNALDGVAASEGRLLFATTQHVHTLDPALARPGRMDVWVEFKNASRPQAADFFRAFFVSKEDADARRLQEEAARAANDPDRIELDGRRRRTDSQGTSSDEEYDIDRHVIAEPMSSQASHATARRRTQSLQTDEEDLPPSDVRNLWAPTTLPLAELDRLAEIFAAQLPEYEFSVADLQGYLLRHKSQPQRAARGLTEWVQEERARRERERLEKERKEREAAEKKAEARRKRREKREREARKLADKEAAEDEAEEARARRAGQAGGEAPVAPAHAQPPPAVLSPQLTQTNQASLPVLACPWPPDESGGWGTWYPDEQQADAGASWVMPSCLSQEQMSVDETSSDEE